MGGNDVDMTAEEKSGREAAPGKSGDEVWPPGLLRDLLYAKAGRSQQPGHEVDARALVARGIRRVETYELLEEFDGAFSRSVVGHSVSHSVRVRHILHGGRYHFLKRKNAAATRRQKPTR
jgi:hypothetical protein